jgi:hypothetical protein
MEPPLFVQLDAERLEREARLVYEQLVRPRWDKDRDGFTQTLYAFMMMVFAQVDRASSLWAGDDGTRGQTQRMVNFMREFLQPGHEANRVAVQIWRHKLMHTARPRKLSHTKTGKKYSWLIHWSQELPRDQHFQFSETPTERILNLALLYLAEDLVAAAVEYLSHLNSNPDLKRNFTSVQGRWGRYVFNPGAARLGD